MLTVAHRLVLLPQRAVNGVSQESLTGVFPEWIATARVILKRQRRSTRVRGQHRCETGSLLESPKFDGPIGWQHP